MDNLAFSSIFQARIMDTDLICGSRLMNVEGKCILQQCSFG